MEIINAIINTIKNLPSDWQLFLFCVVGALFLTYATSTKKR